MSQPISQRTNRIQQAIAPFFEFFTASTFARRESEPNINNFVFGNPHEMPLTGFVNALQQQLTPQNKDWFAYKMNEASSQEVVSASLKARRGVTFNSRDIFMTNGGFAAISLSISVLTDPGDEVIFISPPWFFYEGIIVNHGAVPVRVKVHPKTLGLDLEAIAAAITPRTRAIIINSPNNPTGLIYQPDDLKALAEILTKASERNGRTIYLLSDEAYSRIIFDGQPYYSPTDYYPNSLLLYTYGKTLLTPGQRIGYISLPPTMPDREPLRVAFMSSQVIAGWSFPNALLQHSLADLEKVSIDIPHLQQKRDRLVSALQHSGYEVHVPQGTFYLLPKSPWHDDWAFTELLAEHNIFVLPGKVVELPGYFRISLTANNEMIESAIPGFAAAMAHARTSLPV
ncbi:MAG: aminotransferase class I/II-fold pyridoxal phosphate-dependent enzyme [Anaerolineaceae bacterium]|nr:aminotransferase class I/II-fold pyridoxal phosphate-dependent enzyme [Anaerolineaceae bacterium]